MFKKIIKLIKVISNLRLLKMLLSMGVSGYLKETGWIESFIHGMPVDKYLNPLPWVTYPYIDFISDRLNPDMEVFEFGSGNSTIWYANRVKSVISVEHDKSWYEYMLLRIPKNVTLIFMELDYGGKYSKCIHNFEQNFDIIIIDGRDRVNCIKNSILKLKDRGVIILDDSERIEYNEGIKDLLNKGFKRIDFWGISPGLFYKKCTTIFYKENNCLGI